MEVIGTPLCASKFLGRKEPHKVVHVTSIQSHADVGAL
jgi:hypothetical protein